MNNRDVNLIIEDLRTNCIDLINRSGLPISVAYYVFKDVMRELEDSKENYITRAREQEIKELKQFKESSSEEEVKKEIESLD